MLRGVSRTQGSSGIRKLRAPILTSHLTIMLAGFQRHYDTYDCRMLTSAGLLAFFGLLRVAEFTSPSTTFWDHTSNLGYRDVTFSRGNKNVLIQIKASKTDPFREGCSLRLVSLEHALCPVVALYKYMDIHQRRSGPLYTFSDGFFLTRVQLVAILTRFLGDSASLNSHSFRVGGATSLAAANVPAYIIQRLGRWKSNVFQQYIRFSNNNIGQEAFKSLMQRY